MRAGLSSTVTRRASVMKWRTLNKSGTDCATVRRSEPDESAHVSDTAQGMSDGRPLFAFAFRGGSARVLRSLAEADVAAAAGNADFAWVHLDLRDAAAQAWLRRRPWPPDVVETVAAPIQRGRLFTTTDLVYGHLRDFRDEPEAPTMQAGSLCVVASRT